MVNGLRSRLSAQSRLRYHPPDRAGAPPGRLERRDALRPSIMAPSCIPLIARLSVGSPLRAAHASQRYCRPAETSVLRSTLKRQHRWVPRTAANAVGLPAPLEQFMSTVGLGVLRVLDLDPRRADAVAPIRPAHPLRDGALQVEPTRRPEQVATAV